MSSSSVNQDECFYDWKKWNNSCCKNYFLFNFFTFSFIFSIFGFQLERLYFRAPRDGSNTFPSMNATISLLWHSHEQVGADVVVEWVVVYFVVVVELVDFVVPKVVRRVVVVTFAVYILQFGHTPGYSDGHLGKSLQFGSKSPIVPPRHGIFSHLSFTKWAAEKIQRSSNKS